VTARNDRGARAQATPASLHRAEFQRHNNPPMTVSLQGTGTSKVRKAPSWPRSWANFNLLQLYYHRNAWANFHLLGQPNTFLA
jgi:hypothetical protein